MPAVTSVFRDMTGIRFQHPKWIPENCTACGSCYTVCPDTAIPGLVSEVSQVFDTVVRRLQKNGKGEIKHLPRAARQAERHLRTLLAEAKETDPVSSLLDEAIDKTRRETQLKGDERDELKQEFDWFGKNWETFSSLSRGLTLRSANKSPLARAGY